jgi:hypothetical protein
MTLGVKMEDFQWTELDEKHAKLFHPIEHLPYKRVKARIGAEGDSQEEMAPDILHFLRHFDKQIVDFEQNMGHSDENIKIWYRRHQHAMDNHLTETPTYPVLKVKAKHGNSDMVWDDKKWEHRYSYLVEQRMQLIEQRLKEIDLRPFIPGFFRNVPEEPRRAVLSTSATKRVRGRVLACNWWQPIDQLLTSLAIHWAWDPAQLVETFWNSKYAFPVAGEDDVDVAAPDDTNVKEADHAFMKTVDLPFRTHQ